MIKQYEFTLLVIIKFSLQLQLPLNGTVLLFLSHINNNNNVIFLPE